MKLSNLLIVILSLTFLPSCGGGGGGGSSDPPFEGNKEPAVITSGNMVSFAEGVAGGIELPFIFESGAFAGPLTSSTGPIAVPSATSIPPEHYDGSCGGTLDITYSVVENSTLIEVTAHFVSIDYCEDGSIPSNISTEGSTFNGSIDKVIGESLSLIWEDTYFYNFDADDTSTNSSVGLNGSIEMSWPVGGDPKYTENIVVEFTDNGLVSQYWLKDFQLLRDTLTGMNWFLSGRIYNNEEGYVWLETPVELEPLSPPDLSSGVVFGTVLMHGEASEGRLLFNVSPEYRVELWDGATWGSEQCFDGDWGPVACN